jgi:hypothetical protein
VTPEHQSAAVPITVAPAVVRDPFALPEAVIAARQRPMSERLELALSWNAVATELRIGVAASLDDSP